MPHSLHEPDFILRNDRLKILRLIWSSTFYYFTVDICWFLSSIRRPIQILSHVWLGSILILYCFLIIICPNSPTWNLFGKPWYAFLKFLILQVFSIIILPDWHKLKGGALVSPMWILPVCDWSHDVAITVNNCISSLFVCISKDLHTWVPLVTHVHSHVAVGEGKWKKKLHWFVWGLFVLAHVNWGSKEIILS
jgi:hypothetical protein